MLKAREAKQGNAAPLQPLSPHGIDPNIRQLEEYFEKMQETTMEIGKHVQVLLTEHRNIQKLTGEFGTFLNAFSIEVGDDVPSFASYESSMTLPSGRTVEVVEARFTEKGRQLVASLESLGMKMDQDAPGIVGLVDAYESTLDAVNQILGYCSTIKVHIPPANNCFRGC